MDFFYDHKEIAAVVVAFVFFLGNYVEFRVDGRKDLAIAGNAFVTIALVASVIFWTEVGIYRWIIAVVLTLVCVAATVALYATPSPGARDHPRLNLRKGRGE